MVVQILLQIRKCAFNLIVRIWHPLTLRLLIGKEIRQEMVNAVHCSAKSLVRIVLLACNRGCCFPVQGRLPVLLPAVIQCLELIFLIGGYIVKKTL